MRLDRSLMTARLAGATKPSLMLGWMKTTRASRAAEVRFLARYGPGRVANDAYWDSECYGCEARASRIGLTLMSRVSASLRGGSHTSVFVTDATGASAQSPLASAFSTPRNESRS